MEHSDPPHRPGFLRSFHARLIAGTLVWIFAGVGIGGLLLANVVRGHVEFEYVEELAHHSEELFNLIEPSADTAIHLRAPLSDRRFLTENSGYYWQIERPDGDSLRSPSLGAARLSLGLAFDRPGQTVQTQAPGPTGKVFLREMVVTLAGGRGPARIAVGTDQRLVGELLASFNWTLATTLSILGLGLVAGAYAQISFGLSPLRRLRRALRHIQRGEAAHLPTDLPQEVAPLAASMNELIDAKDEMIRQARIQAGNLAHALKTPLAILLDEGERLRAEGRDSSEIVAQCARMQRQIDFQLAHARAAASRIGPIVGTNLGDALHVVMRAVERLNQGRGLRFTLVPDHLDARVLCGSEDLDEILGNLLDNAAKWARSAIQVSAQPIDGFLRITVEDDGPGMPADARERAFLPGERLDEQKPGSGLGLAIVRDVTGQYGGRTRLDQSPMGGAAVIVELPSAP